MNIGDWKFSHKKNIDKENSIEKSIENSLLLNYKINNKWQPYEAIYKEPQINIEHLIETDIPEYDDNEDNLPILNINTLNIVSRKNKNTLEGNQIVNLFNNKTFSITYNNENIVIVFFNKFIDSQNTTNITQFIPIHHPEGHFLP